MNAPHPQVTSTSSRPVPSVIKAGSSAPRVSAPSASFHNQRAQKPHHRELVGSIKVAPTYLDSIGEALGIIGSHQVTNDISILKPEITLRLNVGKVDILWNKDGQEAVEIQVDRGTGTLAVLAIDTRPDYTDTETFSAPPPAKWKYRAIYTHDAQRIGQWSNVAKITVVG